MTAAPRSRAVLDDRVARAWPPGPNDPRLDNDELHVWLADLDRLQDSLADGSALDAALSTGERLRAAQIARARARRRWIASRAGLRALLARYMRCDARALQLPAGPGKPSLPIDAGGTPLLHFSLSHSRNVALYAIGRVTAVGVDVEAVPRARRSAAPDNYVALALRTFGHERAAALAQIAPRLRERAFLREWTAYEAELKRRGTGIGAGRTQADDELPGWSEQLDVGPHAVGAIAAASAPRALRHWSLAGHCDTPRPRSARRRSSLSRS